MKIHLQPLGSVLLLCLSLACVRSRAGEPPLPPRSAVPASPAELLPLPANSPVSFFRELLRLTPAEQQARLAARPAASRDMLQRKLREYSTLPALERESRLRAVESHYYLKHLLLAPSDVRSNWLAQVPQEYRRAFEDRLRLWSVLPPELQRFLLQQEATLNSVTRLQGATLAERQEILKQLPPGDRLAVEREAARWESLTPLQRDSAWNGVRQMFELSPRDLQRVIAQAALTNRPRAEHLAATLAPLSRSAKQQYAEGLRKYSALDPVQRVRFNQGWERWKGMSESERALWRQVAHHLPPTPAPPVPPLPPLPGTKAPTGVKTGALPPPDRNGNGNGYADSDAARWAAR